MATAAPHVKLLRQLASAKDDYLSGAFDISWDGAKATLYLVFGRPSHAVFDTDQAQIEGEAAIDALLAELPRTFAVSDWRRAMSPQETLSISIDELAGPFVRLAGSYADDPVSDENPEWWSSDDSSPDLAFGLADFPLLPGGRPLWAETSPENVNLAERLAELPPSILILTGAKLRAAAVVSGGDIIDAVWIDDEDQARGEAAGMAILGASNGTLAGYALDDPRVAEALTMLWRLPLAVDGIEMAWLDPASMLAAFRSDGLDRVLVIDAPVRGIALFSRGGLVAVYSETQRSAVASPERLRSLLSQAKGRLTVMERKPRPVAAGAAHSIPSAVDFFAVVAEPEPEAADGAPEPTAVAEDAAPAVAEPEADQSAAAAERDQSAIAESATETEPVAEAVAQSEAGTEPAAGTSDAQADAISEPAADEAEPVADQATDLTASAAVSETDAPPPPPPGDHAAAVADHAPPPPAPEPARKAKRPWWAFGTRRKSATQAPSDADRAAAEAAAAREAAEAASSAGWGIRQPDADAPPPWARPRDYIVSEADAAAAGTEAPPAAPDAPADEIATSETAPAWSAIEPGASHTHWPPPASTETPSDLPETGHAAAGSADEVDAAPPADHDADEAEPAAEDGGTEVEPVHAGSAAAVEPAGEDTAAEEPAPAAAPAWSAREVIADSVSWYQPPEHTDASSGAPVDADHDAPADSETVPSAEAASDAVHDVTAESADAPAAEAEHDADTPRDFWAEFATPDHDAGDAEHEPEPDDAEPLKHKSSERTFAPWNWPLAEAETPAAPASVGRPAPILDEKPEHVTAEAGIEAAPQEAEPDTGAGDEQGFFQRDEPVGSQFVDFDEVRKELVQIGVVWLGERNAFPVTALLTKTRSTIDDFVATIDTIRGLHVEGQDPASIQAMAREMHQQAAERLCGA